MNRLFVYIVNLSIEASILAFAVILIRYFLGKVPKRITVCLWALIAVKLIFPVSAENPLSLMPRDDVISYDNAESYRVYDITESDNDSVIITDGETAEYLPVSISLFRNIWISGMAVMLLYGAVSYFKIKRKVRASLPLSDRIFFCDYIETPFILGIFRPKIYLPSDTYADDIKYVAAHERTHIKRLDHLTKPLGFILLALHWFNPLLWISYGLMGRDMELACDETVVKFMGGEAKKPYSMALVNCSSVRKNIAPCPLAFGEWGVKERVKHILRYKAPTRELVLGSVLLIALAAALFLTRPPAPQSFYMKGGNISDIEPLYIYEHILEYNKTDTAYANTDNFDFILDADFNIQHSGTVRYFFIDKKKTYSAQLRLFPENGMYFLTDADSWIEETRFFSLRMYLEALAHIPKTAIKAISNNADAYSLVIYDGPFPRNGSRHIYYNSEGLRSDDGYEICLMLQPMHRASESGQYTGKGSETAYLFYSHE